MHGANARACQHGNSRFRDHRHIDADAIAFFYPEAFECRGKLANFSVQLAVGDLALHTRIIAFPDDRNLITAGFKMSVQAVVRNIEFGTFKPLDVSLVVVPFLDFVPWRVPVNELIGLLGPERIRVIDGTLVHLLIFLIVDPGPVRRFGAHRVGFRFRHSVLRM